MAIEITGRINLDSSSVDEATQSVKELNEELKSTDETSKNLDKDLKSSFDNVKASADLLGGSVSTLVGGLALLGVENEYIKNLTQGAAGALAFASGVDRLGKGLVGFAKNTKVATGAQRAFNVVANANPYILVATALIGATAAIVALSQALKQTAVEGALANQSATQLAKTLKDNENAAKDLNLSLEDTIKIIGLAIIEAEEELRIFEQTLDIRRLEGATEEQILLDRIEFNKRVVEGLKEQRKQIEEQKEADIDRINTYNEVTKTILQFVAAPLTAILATIDKISEGLVFLGVIDEASTLRDDVFGGISSLIFNPEKTETRINNDIAEIDDGIRTTENIIARSSTQLNNLNKKRNDTDAAQNKAARKKELEELRKFNELLAEEKVNLINSIESLENEFLDSQLSREDQELNAVRDKYFSIIEAAREAGEDVALLEEALQAKLTEIRNKFATQRRQDELDTNQRLIDAERQLQDAKIDLTINGIGAINDLITGFVTGNEQAQRKAFNAQKALAIAETTISTYAAAQVAYQGQLAATIPPDPTGPIRATIAAGIAITQGLARVAAISKQQFNPSGSSGSAPRPSTGGGGSSSAIQSATPQINFTGTGANTVGGPGAGNDTNLTTPTLIRAYVSETDLTNTNTRLDLIKNGAEL